MGPSLDGAVDVVRAAERIAMSAMRLLGARRARLVWRLEPDPAPMTWVTAPAEDTLPGAPGGAAAELAFGERALREGRALCTPDVLAERHLALDPSAREAIARGGLGALAAVPVLTAGVAAGSLVLATVTGRRFTEPEMALLSSLAEQMALVLENAQLERTTTRTGSTSRGGSSWRGSAPRPGGWPISSTTSCSTRASSSARSSAGRSPSSRSWIRCWTTWRARSRPAV